MQVGTRPHMTVVAGSQLVGCVRVGTRGLRLLEGRAGIIAVRTKFHCVCQ